MSEAQLERLHAGLVKLASMDEPVLAALVEQVLAGDDELASSLVVLAREQEADREGTPAQLEVPPRADYRPGAEA